MRKREMNTNDIMKNWNEYTNTNTVQDYADVYGDYDTEMTICDFCDNYNYNGDVYRYLYNSYNL